MYRTFGSQHGYGLSDRNHEKHNILGMSEFWGLNVTSPNESRCSYNKRIDSHTTRSTGQPPTVPLHPVIPCFLGTEHQEGVSCHLVVSKRYHICDTKCIFQWYLKKYHICGTKTSIVVSKDTTYVVHFADASKKGLFSDSPFCFLSASAR